MPDDLATLSETGMRLELPVPPRSSQQGTVERCDVTQHRNEIISLFQREGKAHFADRFSWYYRNQGQEMPTSWVLRNKKAKICGLCSVTIRTLRYGDSVVKAGVSGNLLVDRTSGLYLGAFSLVRAAMSLVTKGEIDILLGSPNRLAQPVFKRLEFRLIDMWETRAMIYRSLALLRARFGFIGTLISPVIDVGAIARRAFSRQSLAACDGFRLVNMRESELNELRIESWKVPSERFVVCASSDYLIWRFIRDPVTPCEIVAVFAQSGEPCAYLARRRAANRISVTDCAVDSRQISDATAIACLCRKQESQKSTVWVTTLRSSSLSHQLSSAGFVPIRASTGSTAPLVGFWLPEHPLAAAFARPAAWSLFPGFNDV